MNTMCPTKIESNLMNLLESFGWRPFWGPDQPVSVVSMPKQWGFLNYKSLPMKYFAIHKITTTHPECNQSDQQNHYLLSRSKNHLVRLHIVHVSWWCLLRSTINGLFSRVQDQPQAFRTALADGCSFLGLAYRLTQFFARLSTLVMETRITRDGMDWNETVSSWGIVVWYCYIGQKFKILYCW